MDRDRFDALTRSLVTRRAGIGVGLAALLGLASETDAKKKPKPKTCKPKCAICKKCVKGTCKLKSGACPGGTCRQGRCVASPPPPTCSDGVTNGDETGVDCGGPACPRCANGQRCASLNDCASARCTGVCAACATDADCGASCLCFSGGVNGFCASRTSSAAASCADCPPGTINCFGVPSGGVRCFPRCGAS